MNFEEECTHRHRGKNLGNVPELDEHIWDNDTGPGYVVYPKNDCRIKFGNIESCRKFVSEHINDFSPKLIVAYEREVSKLRRTQNPNETINIRELMRNPDNLLPPETNGEPRTETIIIGNRHVSITLRQAAALNLWLLKSMG